MGWEPFFLRLRLGVSGMPKLAHLGFLQKLTFNEPAGGGNLKPAEEIVTKITPLESLDPRGIVVN
jgi:hypothetical protein